MPELPEVETIRLGLSHKIIGLTLKKIEVLNKKTFQGDVKNLRGRKVLKVWRRAKLLGINLADSHQSSAISSQTKKRKSLTTEDRQLMTLLFHLKMTGQLIYIKDQKSNIKNRIIGGHPTPDMRDEMPSKSTRVIFEFSDGSKLFFNDQRKFGWIRLLNEPSTMNHLLSTLGPEPLEKGFTWQVLKSNLLHHKSMPIKVALMDQTVVSGVGNIYSNETCFNGGVDPRTKVKNLNDAQFKKLHAGVIKALEDGIKHGGSTRAHFVDPEGKKGYFLDYAYCYGMSGKKCKICGSIIKKISLGGRGTYFCEHCQK